MIGPIDELKLTGNMPTPAGVGMRILQITQSEDFAAGDIAQAIRSDPALTGRIVKMANSAGAAGMKAVTTVNEAVVRLGARTVSNVALGFSLVSAYRRGSCAAFDYARYWSQSLARAVACQSLSAKLRLAAPAEAYICGLLSGIGRLAFACVHPESYAEVLRCAGGRGELRLAEIERRTYQVDHRELGTALLKDWQMPRAYGSAIARYAIPPAPGDEDEPLRLLLHVAAAIAEFCLAAEGDHAARYRTVEERAGHLPIDAASLAAACDQIASEWQSWGRTLAITTRAVPPAAAIRETGRRAPAEATPDVDAHPDACAAIEAVLQQDGLAEPDGSDGPYGPDGSDEPLTVLAVDDDADALEELASQLLGAGMRVLRATDGEEALRLALETNPHMVVTDWRMPRLDGLELTRSLRRIDAGKEMFILLLATREDENRALEGFEAGVDDYVTKPFNPRVLMSRIGAGERTMRLKDEVTRDKRKMERQFARLSVLKRRIESLADRDAATGLFNRRKAIAVLEEEWNQPHRALSVIRVDLDGFDAVLADANVAEGALARAAGALRRVTRETDSVCRLDGEQFLVVCPGADARAATAIAERLRRAVEDADLRFARAARTLTASIGVAQKRAAESVDDLLKAAAAAVATAKERGRNRVEVCLP